MSMKLFSLILLCLIHFSVIAATTEKAIFAGGCFWCMEPPFDKLPGVLQTTSGYIGGQTPNPTYKLVSSGNTNYAEAVQVTFDPSKVSYQKLLKVFWRNIDPTRNDGQFCDHGKQYRPGIFYLNAEQKHLAEKSKQKIQKSGKIKKPILVEITKAKKFYPAEAYHQNYYKKHPWLYKYYRYRCGRDRRLMELWG